MRKEALRTRKNEVLSSHLVESSRPSLTTVSFDVQTEEKKTDVTGHDKVTGSDFGRVVMLSNDALRTN